MKTISIITTFYNAKDFILNAINSVNQQKIDTKAFNIEYIIVDDKSPDESRALIENYIKEQANPNINFRIIEPEQNLGCGGARKFGIDNATGDYYMFLDADDYYLRNDFVYRAYNDIVKEKADIVEYGIIVNQPNGHRSVSCAPNKIICTNSEQALRLLFGDNIIKFNVWSKIYTKNIVKSYPYSMERTFEDVRTIPVWVSNAKKIVIMTTPEVNYRAASNSIIRTDMIKTRLGTITAIAELFERFKKYPLVLKDMYKRSMVDLEIMLHNHSSNDEGFNEMSRLNTYMLSFLYPDTYKEFTFHIEDELKTN